MSTTDTLIDASPESVGMRADLGAVLDSVVNAGIANGATPGAELAVGRYGRLVHMRGYGHLDPAPGSPVPNDSTLWDMASLTKVIATTTAAMILEEEGKLDLDKPVHDYLPEFDAPDKAGITVRMLLEHRGGMESGSKLWKHFRGKAAFLQQINARPLAYTPNDSSIYSDWDLVLTGFIIERITGMPEDQYLKQRVFGPLGMHDTGWNPLVTGPFSMPADSDCTAQLALATPERLARIAPTEVDTVYRHRHIHGIVHDENTCAMGGVAGHAGLFSSGRDLAKFAQMLLNGGEYGDVRLLHPSTIARWTANRHLGSSRATGWDTPSLNSSAGHYFSPRSFGHTGFTGTSIWVDPEKGVFVILLTNRVNPTRANTKVFALRRDVADAVQKSILDAPLIDWEARNIVQ
jgi:CubicO group peptidase (beta-lactamase class C family)